jgi:hypothetical protein
MAALAVVCACSGAEPTSPDPPPSSSPPSPTPSTGVAFGAFVNVHPASTSSSGEPTLQIGRDGRLWSTDLGPCRMWTSSDRGATWTSVASPPGFGGDGCGDMDAAQDDAGRVHVVDLKRTTACFAYYRTSDGGTTFDVIQSSSGGGAWAPGDGACGSSGHVDRPWVATWGADTVYIVFKDEGNHAPGVEVSTDGGRTFAHAPAFPFPEPQGLAVDPADGALYVIGEELDHYDSSVGRSVGRAVRVAASRDGRTFTPSLVFETRQADVAAGGFPSIAVDAAHNVYAAWSDNSAGTTDVYVSVSRTRGATWSAPMRVSRGLTLAVYPTLVAGDDGRIGIAWYGTADSAKSYNEAAGAAWYVYAALSTNALDAAPSFETVKVSDQPFHHDSMCSHVDVCEGADLTTGQQPPDYLRKRKILDFFRTAIDPSGAVNVAWADSGNPLGEDHFARQVSGAFLKRASISPALTETIDRINTLSRKPATLPRETTIRESELNTYFPQLAREQISPGLQDPTVTLLDANHVTLRATVHGAPLVVQGTLATHNGTATFGVESALLGGALLSSSTLEERLKTYASSDGRFAWHLGDSFQLPAAIRELRVSRGQLVVIQ